MAEKTPAEMAKDLKLNPDKFKTADKNVLAALKKAHDFKMKAAAKVKK